jgi:purine-nucleoside phosphorylase
MEPVHLVTNKENIADIVLLPGDPLRAKYIADNFLENAELVNTIRNMYAFTGTYKGKRITVMGSGMGMPSMGIYAYELYHFYNVSKIIRIGTSGAYSNNVHVGDVVLSTAAYTPSNFAYSYSNEQIHIEKASEGLNNTIKETAKELNIDILTGPTITNDVFDVYVNIEHLKNNNPLNDELLAKEMEAFALFHIARKENKDASALISVVDSDFEDAIITPEDRETKLNNMIKLALESIIK